MSRTGMPIILICTGLLAAMVQLSTGLQCYVCNTVEGDSDCSFSNGPVFDHLENCPAGLDQCFTEYEFNDGVTTVRRECSTLSACWPFRKKRDRNLDYDIDCCDDSSGCNDERYTQGSPPDTDGLQCYVCDSEQGDSNCFFSGGPVDTHVQDCQTNEDHCVAEYTKHQTGNMNVRRACSSSCLSRKKRDIDIDYDYDCCEADKCNDESYDESAPPDPEGLQCYVCNSAQGDSDCSFYNGAVATYLEDCSTGETICINQYEEDQDGNKNVRRACSDTCLSRKKRDINLDYDCCHTNGCNDDRYNEISPPDPDGLQCYVCDSEQGDTDCFFSSGSVSEHLQTCQSSQGHCVVKYIKDLSGDKTMKRSCSDNCIDRKKREIDPDYDYDCCETDGCNDEGYDGSSASSLAASVTCVIMCLILYI